jgi:hypothetical protein
MRRPCRPILIALAVLICCGSAALAEDPPQDPSGTKTRPTSGADRFYLAFAEDATVVDRQWWEGQLVIRDYDDFDANVLDLVLALQPWIDWEIGANVGFGNTDGMGGFDGSGATDLDVWGKYYLGGGDNTEWSVGGVLTIPTGDESAGLGSDSFGSSAFGAFRLRLKRLVLAAHAGIQFNGSGRRFDEVDSRDGETVPQLGGGIIFPFSDKLSGIAEAVYREGRLKGDSDMSEALVGINWRPGGRGIFRAAIGAGLSSGAPDFSAQIGYAAQF